MFDGAPQDFSLSKGASNNIFFYYENQLKSCFMTVLFIQLHTTTVMQSHFFDFFQLTRIFLNCDSVVRIYVHPNCFFFYSSALAAIGQFHTQLLNNSSAIRHLSCGSTRLCPVLLSLCLSEAKKWYHLSVEQPFYVEKPQGNCSV